MRLILALIAQIAWRQHRSNVWSQWNLSFRVFVYPFSRQKRNISQLKPVPLWGDAWIEQEICMLVFHHQETQRAGDRDVSLNVPRAPWERPTILKSFSKDCWCGFPQLLLSILCRANFLDYQLKDASTALAMGKDRYPFPMHPVTWTWDGSTKKEPRCPFHPCPRIATHIFDHTLP